MLTTMLVALLAANPDGTLLKNRVPLLPMCWRVDAGPSTTFSLYVRGHARLFAADHAGWWTTDWDEGVSYGHGAWERVAVRIDNLFGVVCMVGLDGSVFWGAMMVQEPFRFEAMRTNQLLHSNELPAFRVTCASSDPSECR